MYFRLPLTRDTPARASIPAALFLVVGLTRSVRESAEAKHSSDGPNPCTFGDPRLDCLSVALEATRTRRRTSSRLSSPCLICDAVCDVTTPVRPDMLLIAALDGQHYDPLQSRMNTRPDSIAADCCYYRVVSYEARGRVFESPRAYHFLILTAPALYRRASGNRAFRDRRFG